jgi:hypothetical protein
MLAAAGAQGGLHCRTRSTEAVPMQNTLVSSLENERKFIKVKYQRWLHKDLIFTSKHSTKLTMEQEPFCVKNFTHLTVAKT